MDSIKRSVERRSKGYERVELSDPDDPGSPGSPGGSPAAPLQAATDKLRSDEAGQRSIRILCLVHFINFTGMHLTTLPYPKLVNQLMNGNMQVTAESSYAAGWLISTNSLTQFLAVKFWSVASDAHGRKPYLLMGMLALMAYAIIFATARSISALLIGFTLEGTFATGWTIGQAYLSDASSPDKRAVNYATYYGITQGTALGVGVVGGVALLMVNLRLPFISAAVLLALDVPLTMWLLPESLPPSKRVPLDRPCAQGNPYRGVSMVWRRGAHFRDMMTAYCMAQVAQLFMANTWINFTDAAFGWGIETAGASIILYGAMLTPVPPRLIAKLGEQDAMVKGLQLLCLGFTILALAGLGGHHWSWLVWPTIGINCCGMMFDSAMRSYITKLLPEGEQGSLQGTLSALTLLCNVAAGFVSNHLLGYLISSSSPVYWPGGHLVVAALLFGAAARSTRRALEGAPSQRGLPVRNAAGCPAASFCDILMFCFLQADMSTPMTKAPKFEIGEESPTPAHESTEAAEPNPSGQTPPGDDVARGP